jgi:hypothetical protein
LDQTASRVGRDVLAVLPGMEVWSGECSMTDGMDVYVCQTCNKSEELSHNLKSDCRDALFICTGCGARGFLGKQFIRQDAISEMAL